jgi:hypothetical protein
MASALVGLRHGRSREDRHRDRSRHIAAAAPGVVAHIA